MIRRGRGAPGVGRLGRQGRGNAAVTVQPSQRAAQTGYSVWGKVAFIDVLKRWAMLWAILELRKCVVSDDDSCEGRETTLQTIASKVPRASYPGMCTGMYCRSVVDGVWMCILEMCTVRV